MSMDKTSPPDLRDLLAGAAVALLGAVFFFSARGLPDGPPGQIGPGFVPMAVGLIAVGLGLVIAARSLNRPGALPKVAVRPVLAIFLAVAVFGLLIRSTGLAPALTATTIIAAIGSPKSQPVKVVTLALCVAVGSCLLFIVLLGLPFDAFRNPFR